MSIHWSILSPNAFTKTNASSWGRRRSSFVRKMASFATKKYNKRRCFFYSASYDREICSTKGLARCL